MVRVIDGPEIELLGECGCIVEEHWPDREVLASIPSGGTFVFLSKTH